MSRRLPLGTQGREQREAWIKQAAGGSRRVVTTKLDELRSIARAIGPHLHRTPLLRNRTLSEQLGVDLFLKIELFQKTGSYKPRGMLNRLLTLSDSERAAGVMTFSAGNAAQGLAYAARIVGTKAVVVMAATASPSKLEATRDYGAEVVRCGTLVECAALSERLARERGLIFISSYDDVELMKGHASLGLEIVDDLPDVEAILLGIGGGGMAGGIAMAVSALGCEARLIGVEPEGAASTVLSLRAGKPVQLETVNTIADGLAAPSTGTACFPLIRDSFAEVVTVTDQDIRSAMLAIMTRTKLFVEPAGAAGLAAALAHPKLLKPGSRVVCVLSGGNMDPNRLKALL